MSVNKNVKDSLSYYLTEETPEYAFLLSGAWGAGKTYFIDEFISDYKVENIKLIKISLFGLKSTSDIDAKIFEILHPVLGSRYAKIAGNILKGAISLGVKVDLDGNSKDDVNLGFKADKINLREFVTGKKSDIALVFDDLERTDISIREILGYINYLVEILKVKVILIANEKIILEDGGAKDTYVKFKEKVIGRTFEVKHDFGTIVSGFLNGVSYKKMIELKVLISEAHAISECDNLRKIKQSIYDFDYLCSRIDGKYLENKEFYYALARIFFALSIEVKKGELNEEELRSKFPFQGNARPIYKKYFPKNDLIFSGNLWADIIFKGDFDQLEEHASRLPYFVKENKLEVPVWLKLWSFKELEAEEFNELLCKLREAFQCLDESELPAYLNILDLILYFSKSGLLDLSAVEIKNIVERYVDKYKETDHWKEVLLDGGGYYGTGRPYYCDGDLDFSTMRDSIFEINKKIYVDEKAKQVARTNAECYAEFLAAIEIGEMELISTTFRKFEHSCFLDAIDPVSFVRSLLISKHSAVEDFIRLVFGRYASNRSLNGRPYYSYLKNEIIFWEGVEAVLQERLEQLSGIKRHIFELLSLKTIPLIKDILSS